MLLILNMAEGESRWYDAWALPPSAWPSRPGVAGA